MSHYDPTDKWGPGFSKAAPSAGSEKCPTCGSESPTVHKCRISHVCDSLTSGRCVYCSDKGHFPPESGKEGETNAVQNATNCCSSVRSSDAGIPVSGANPYPLTPSPAQGAEEVCKQIMWCGFVERALPILAAHVAHVTAAKDAEWRAAANNLIDYIEAHGWGSIPEPYDSINPLLTLLGREALTTETDGGGK